MNDFVERRWVVQQKTVELKHVSRWSPPEQRLMIG